MFRYPFGSIFGKSLRNKLLSFFLLTVLIPFGAFAFMVYHTVRIEAEDSVAREMIALSRAAGQTVKLFLKERVNDQIVWSGLPVLKEAVAFNEVRESAEDTLRTMVKLYPCYEAVMLMDKRGICVISTQEGFAGKDFSKAPFFANAARDVLIKDLSREPLLLHSSDNSGCMRIGMSAAVFYQGEQIGVLTSLLKLSSIEAILAETRVGKTGYVFMVDGDRKVICYPTAQLCNEPLAGPKLGLPALDRAIENRESHVALLHHNPTTGKRDHQIVGISYPDWDGPLSGLGWQLAAGADIRETMSFLPDIVLNLSIGGASITLIIILLSVYLAGAIMNPITALTSRVEKVREGGPAPDFSAVSAYEELQPLITAIRDYHVMVEQRTGELVLINKQLSQEINERMVVETSWRESEQRYRSLFEESKDAIFIVQPEGTILDANPACSELLGSPRGDIVGANALHFYRNPAERERFIKEVTLIGFVREFPVTLMRKDGTDRNCLLTSSLLKDASGEVAAYCTIVRDVTDSRLLEKQLFQAQKMEAVGILAGGVAHDFNNLLQVINGYADLALFEIAERGKGYFRIQEIKKTANYAAELTQGLLTFSRQVESKLRPVNLNEELKKVVKMLDRTLPKMIEIRMDLADPLSTINADPAQLHQIVMNLSLNAGDAMPNGGRLTIKTENQLVNSGYRHTHLNALPGNYVVLSITDTGLGMDEKTKQHIFEPFFTTKITGKGTGLGLSIVFGIVQSHGGEIICDSEPGKGTSFRIYLPEIGIKAEEVKVEPAEFLPRGTETILVVDDEEGVRNVLSDLLIQFGYRVVTAVNGREGLEVFCRKQHQIDLVILDLYMPEMGGKECLREILKIDPRAKIMIASGFSGQTEINRMIETGAKAYIGKPYEAKQLLKRVRQILDNT